MVVVYQNCLPNIDSAPCSGPILLSARLHRIAILTRLFWILFGGGVLPIVRFHGGTDAKQLVIILRDRRLKSATGFAGSCRHTEEMSTRNPGGDLLRMLMEELR